MGVSKPSSSTTAKATPEPETPRFTPCPRPELSAEHTDWITFADARYKVFNICPSCFNTSIAHTSHASSFQQRSWRRSASIEFSCDFSRSWVRIAWCWILSSTARTDVNVLVRVAAIVDPDGPCPNGIILGTEGDLKEETTRLWYSIPDPDKIGGFLEKFTICSFCLASMYKIWPCIGKATPFSRASDTTCPGTCDIFWGASPRTMAYVELLIATELAARKNKGKINIDNFTQYVARYAGRGECHKGQLTTGNCHVMPQIPEFKVCEECYADYIKPYPCNPIAEEFCEEPIHAADGFVCNLYSESMRKIWTDAVNNHDIKALKKHVAARSAKKDEVDMQLAAIKMKIKVQLNRVKINQRLASSRPSLQAAQSNAMVSMYGIVPINDQSQVATFSEQSRECEIEALKLTREEEAVRRDWKLNWE